MKNVTLAIDEKLLSDGRQLAANRNTTLNSLVRNLLAHEIAQEARIAEAREGLKRLMDQSTLDMGPNYRWNRQEIYDERENRLLSRHERPGLRGSDKQKG